MALRRLLYSCWSQIFFFFFFFVSSFSFVLQQEKFSLMIFLFSPPSCSSLHHYWHHRCTSCRWNTNAHHHHKLFCPQNRDPTLMMMATSAEFSTSLVLCSISKTPIWNLINFSTAITVLLLLLLSLSLSARDSSTLHISHGTWADHKSCKFLGYGKWVSRAPISETFTEQGQVQSGSSNVMTIQQRNTLSICPLLRQYTNKTRTSSRPTTAIDVENDLLHAIPSF